MSDIAAALPMHADDVPQRFCPDCGYDLRALSSDRCPECGLVIDENAFAASPIPWVHRKRIGRFRAFQRTVRFTTFHPKRLAAAAAVPVDYRDAQRFRRAVVLRAALPFVATLIVLTIFGKLELLMGIAALFTSPYASFTAPGSTPSLWLIDPVLCWIAGAMIPGIMPIGVVIVFALLVALPSYWFHPKHLSVIQQNRAIAICAYASGPLAWLLPLALFAAGALGLAGLQSQAKSFFFLFVSLACLAGLAAALLLLVMWWNTLRVLSRTTHASAGRLIVVGAAIPVDAVFSVLIGIVVFPAIVGFIWLMIDSIR